MRRRNSQNVCEKSGGTNYHQVIHNNFANFVVMKMPFKTVSHNLKIRKTLNWINMAAPISYSNIDFWLITPVSFARILISHNTCKKKITNENSDTNQLSTCRFLNGDASFIHNCFVNFSSWKYPLRQFLTIRRLQKVLCEEMWHHQSVIQMSVSDWWRRFYSQQFCEFHRYDATFHRDEMRKMLSN